MDGRPFGRGFVSKCVKCDGQIVNEEVYVKPTTGEHYCESCMWTEMRECPNNVAVSKKSVVA